MNGLDLFTGIGGISLALRDYVRPIAYCEIDPYCQSVLLSRMQAGDLPKAPIWDDIRTLSKSIICPDIDIIYGGFPCQDISIAGRGAGLAGERSGLFFEIVRLYSEIRPRFIFLENVPAITSRGGARVVGEITKMGYDCRWCVISAASVGALHRRERWFLLAHAKHDGASACENGGSIGKCSSSGEGEGEQTESIGEIERTGGLSSDVAYTHGNAIWQQSRRGSRQDGKDTLQFGTNGVEKFMANSSSERLPGLQNGRRRNESEKSKSSLHHKTGFYWPFESRSHWQEVVSEVCRVDDGVSCRVDRLKALGNSVVPQQVLRAFELLMGIK